VTLLVCDDLSSLWISHGVTSRKLITSGTQIEKESGDESPAVSDVVRITLTRSYGESHLAVRTN
jgi:hypothetical protein